MTKVITKINNLYIKLLSSKMKFYGEDWSDWDNGSTYVKDPCIYILWKTSKSKRPMYVGETKNLGKRLAEHNRSGGWSGKKWEYVQYVSGKSLLHGEFRRLLESFCIYLLNPIDNDYRQKKRYK